jgi:hypothetical protein
MNNFLKQQMSHYFTPEQQAQDEDRGGSSIEYTAKLRHKLPLLLKKHNIQSMFDAGCNDCSWMSTLIDNLDYYGGDISQPMIIDLQNRHPNLKVSHHDVTTDPLPTVDLLFVKDVTIHLNNADKKKVIQNWLSSGIPWLMITHDEFEDNLDFNSEDGFPFAFVNWQREPWNFPTPTDVVHEVDSAGRCMALWHRDQLCQWPV